MDILSFKPDFRYSTFKNYEAFSSFIHQIIYEYEKLINTKYEDEFIKLKNRFIHFINSKYRNKQMYNLLYKNITFNSYFTWEDAIGYMIPGRYK